MGGPVPALTCYRIDPRYQSQELVDVVDTAGSVEATEPIAGRGFTAQAFILQTPPHQMPWAPFLQAGFPDLVIGRSASTSAVLVVRIRAEDSESEAGPTFAFAFGTTGRFLLRRDSFVRGYGLRTALNIMYPRSGADGARLRAVDSKRRAETVVRARTQSSSQVEFELFDVNQMRDVLSKAVGMPADPRWGTRVSGSDPLALNIDLGFDDLGVLCRDIEKASKQQDYRDRFAWIDNIRPVADLLEVEELQGQLVDRLHSRALDGLDLAPPEIVDWDRVAAFRYHFDRRRRNGGSVLHHELRIQDYLAGVARTTGLDALDIDSLRNASVFAVDGDESEQARWSIWRCIIGEFELDGRTFLLDEGEFVEVSSDYIAELNDTVSRIPIASVSLPATTVATHEGGYNEAAAQASQELLLLDKRTVRVPGRTTAIEICDLLSRNRQLIHVKRHLGSSDLSHLFAQGLVSAELLQSSVDFRRAASDQIRAVAGSRDGFDFLTESSIVTSDYEVIYAIVERWNGRTLQDALPFFSKVNLREVIGNLTSRGFKVAMIQVPAS
jgi:uncharacterized protein (TIGR04141 family)